MASIKSNNSQEIGRWERKGEILVLCSDGRLLAKIPYQTSWLIRSRNVSLIQIEHAMERTGGVKIEKNTYGSIKKPLPLVRESQHLDMFKDVNCE